MMALMQYALIFYDFQLILARMGARGVEAGGRSRPPEGARVVRRAADPGWREG